MNQRNKKKLVVLSGAGMSAESGIRTFRDHDGLWEGFSIDEVATHEAWERNPMLVNQFYNQRRQQLLHVEPNAGHHALVDLESHFDVTIVTQNVDDLHERAGSSNVLHLHGELRKVRSTKLPTYIIDWDKPLTLEDKCPEGGMLRPHIVWFGEEVTMMDRAVRIVEDADVVLIVGTSMVVYPAAGLIQFASRASMVYYVDKNPATIHGPIGNRTKILSGPAGSLLPSLVAQLINQA